MVFFTKIFVSHTTKTTPRMTSKPLVLLHGWGMNPSIWSALPEALAPGRARHPLALPGHGGSPWQPDWTALPHWAEACLAQAPEQAVWLGWSLGGLVALQAARQAPKRVKALILIASTPRFTQAQDWRLAMPADTFGQFHQSLLDDPTTTLQRFLSLQVRGSEQAPRLLKQLRQALAAAPATTPEALRIGLDLLREEDLRGPLPDVRQPTLWIFGQRDTLVPAALTERIDWLHPQASWVCIQGAGHAPFLSHPAQVSDAIHAFLAGIDA